MGAAMGCGAHLAEIVRTAVGEFTLDQAVNRRGRSPSVPGQPKSDPRYVIPLERLLPELPSVTVLPLLRNSACVTGQKFNVQIAQIQPGRVSAAQGAPFAELNSGEWKPARVRVLGQQERLIAIAEAVVPRTYQPVVVLEAEV